MRYWHVTLQSRLPGILAHGLLVDPPERTFAAGRAVYLADSPSAARRWAGEVARQLGAVTPMALLEVDTVGMMSVRVNSTEVGVAQVLVRDNVVAERLRVVELFDAAPRHNPRRVRGGSSATPQRAHRARGVDEDDARSR